MKFKIQTGIWCKTRYILYVFIFSCFVCSGLQARDKDLRSDAVDKTVTGKISDDHGNAIRGVNVQEKGTTRGAVSDATGKFSLNVSGDSSVLVFTAVGYVSQEIPVGSSTQINVTMELTSKKLDEVVVVGYGTQKKSELTNAVVQTSGEQLKKSTAVSLSNSLSGRMAGLYINQRGSVPGFDDAQILVRGSNM